MLFRSEGENCDGTSSSVEDSEESYEALALLAQVAGLAMLEPDGENAAQFHGSETLIHEEQELPGGSSLLDLKVTWNLSRPPQN